MHEPPRAILSRGNPMGEAERDQAWSLRGLQLKLLKMGGRLVRYARHITFQLAEVGVSRKTFALILERIKR